MRRFYDSIKVLGMRDRKIAEEFKDRDVLPLYKFIENNSFKPFHVGDKMIKAYAKMAREKNIPNPLSRKVLRRLATIEKKLFRQKLNSDYVIDKDKYLFSGEKKVFGKQSKLPTPPLKEQPMPSAEVVSNTQIPDVSQTGLTQTEQALLSPEEKSIRLRQRGLQT